MERFSSEELANVEVERQPNRANAGFSSATSVTCP